MLTSRVLLVVGLAYLSPTALASTIECRCYPGENCWPSPEDWATLNSSVSGRLVATVPLGSPCHDPIYNAAVCKTLQENWVWPQEQSVPEYRRPSPMLRLAATCPLHRSWHPSSPTRVVTRSRQSLGPVLWVTM